MQDNLARQSASQGYFLLEDEECLQVRNAMQGRVVGKKSPIRTSGQKESAGFSNHVAQKRRRSCLVDLAVSHLADGRCGLWTAIRSSKLHVAQSAGYIRTMMAKKQSQLLLQGSEMVKYGGLD
jgi:hypothetical protein